MNIARVWLAVAAALAVVSLVVLGVAVWPVWPVATISARDGGGSCAGWSGERSRTMTAAVVVRNDSGSDAEVLGVVATRQQGEGAVRYRVIPGSAVQEGYGTATFLAQGHPIVSARGAVLPAHRNSTVLVTVTIAPGSQLVALGHLDVSTRGPLGTVRSGDIATTLGFMAPGQRVCDLAAVS